MKIFLRILRYVRPYWKWLALSVLCTIIFTILSAASIALTIPLLETLFSQPAAQGQSVQSVQAPASVTAPVDSLSVTSRLSAAKDSVMRRLNAYLYTGDKTDTLFKICVIILLMFFFKNLFDYLQSYLMAYVEQGSMMDIRNDLYEHMHNLSLGYFSNERTGSLISRVTNDVNVVNGGVSATFVTMLKQPLLIIVFLGMAIALSW
ncbi:MAG TPA: ABC transporter transmembrane domain-containing protein, partial [Bacteroidota bacterium]|nr:ABC transporter transmembrane domain-containing protein [Bacteroidota bacterium]